MIDIRIFQSQAIEIRKTILTAQQGLIAKVETIKITASSLIKHWKTSPSEKKKQGWLG
jgi:hypothetical protein